MGAENLIWGGTRDVSQEKLTSILEVAAEAKQQVERFIQDGKIEQILTEEEIFKRIDAYLETNGENILQYLGETGKVFVPMDSAKKFAEYVCQKLRIPEERIIRHKISTYKGGTSTGKELPEESKKTISELTAGCESVLVVEDLIDEGHTLSILEDTLGKNTQTRYICLFDKQVESSRENRKKLGDRLESIIPIGPSFIVGFGIDFEQRLCAQRKGLWRVNKESEREVAGVLSPFAERIAAIINS